jgi:hypothetical protein
MYQINVKLGFKPTPAWLELHKRLTPTDGVGELLS